MLTVETMGADQKDHYGNNLIVSARAGRRWVFARNAGRVRCEERNFIDLFTAMVILIANLKCFYYY